MLKRMQDSDSDSVSSQEGTPKKKKSKGETFADEASESDDEDGADNKGW